MELVTMLLVWTAFFGPSLSEEIRCYCNAASCVTTGYLCKSVLGRCYSHFTSESASNTMRVFHGCVEALSGDDRTSCLNEEDQMKSSSMEEERVWPLLTCCQQDMCNYIVENTNENINLTRSGTVKSSSALSPSSEISERDLWFKAAVIAVPIAGGFILILLVLLAVRMLRNDNRRQRHLVHAARQQRSLTKAQLFVADHFYPNNENEHLNCGGEVNPASSSSHYSSKHLHHKPHHHHYHHYCSDSDYASSVNTSGCYGNSKTSIYRDISVKKTDKCHGNSRHGYEKIRPCSEASSGREGSVTSVILWSGEPNKTRPNFITDV